MWQYMWLLRWYKNKYFNNIVSHFFFRLMAKTILTKYQNIRDYFGTFETLEIILTYRTIIRDQKCNLAKI